MSLKLSLCYDEDMDIPLRVTAQGLCCPAGDFYIDAWKPVPTCIVTHAHGDHAYWGHQRYIASPETVVLLQHRLGKDRPLQPLAYGEKLRLGDCWVSLHPAGHILGASQVRIETANSVTVVSGDYKRAADGTCRPFEPVECDIFVTESTFALPIYHWAASEIIRDQMITWWHENASQGHPSIIFAYSLGKAQRIMNLLAEQQGKTIYLHGAVQALASVYKDLGVNMIPFAPVSEQARRATYRQDLILAPPSAMGSPWMKRFPSARTAFASGWMEVRGTRRRKALDKGFVLSDHADWTGLISTIQETKAKIILTTHGNTATLAHYLRDSLGLDARELQGLTQVEDED